MHRFITRRCLGALSTFLVATALLAGLAACDASGLETEPAPGEGNDTTPPPAPSGLTGTSQDGTVALAWEASSAGDLAGYHVYRAGSAFEETGAADRMGGEAPREERAYDDTEAENGTHYYYRVTAVDEVGNESGLSNMVERTPFPDPPDEPE